MKLLDIDESVELKYSEEEQKCFKILKVGIPRTELNAPM